jgi:drug/metabolite transporter (DMT)-like permease
MAIQDNDIHICLPWQVLSLAVGPNYPSGMSNPTTISVRQANLLLLLASMIWGLAFVAQRVGMRHIEPFTFNAVRFALGALVLTPLMVFGLPVLPGRARRSRTVPWRRSLRGGIIAGLFLFGGATLQQYGVVFTTAGKAGFITSLYVVLVPVLGLLIGQRSGRTLWFGMGLSAVGLYLLSAQGLLGIALGDGLVLIGAIFWALHVLAVDRLVSGASAIDLAVIQFLVVAALSLVGALLFETITWPGIRAAARPILFTGCLSVAVAYTLQVVGQTRARPAHAAIILGLESVFAAVGGWIVLAEGLSARGLFGCALMLAGVLVSQLGPETADHQPGGQPSTPVA